MLKRRANDRDIFGELDRTEVAEVFAELGLKGLESEFELGAVGRMKVALQLLESLHCCQQGRDQSRNGSQQLIIVVEHVR